jgi:hypothetical protein
LLFFADDNALFISDVNVDRAVLKLHRETLVLEMAHYIVTGESTA